jgi:hypothetical protein
MLGLTVPSMSKPSSPRVPPSSRPVSPLFTTSGRESEAVANHGQAGVELMLETGAFTSRKGNFRPPAKRMVPWRAQSSSILPLVFSPCAGITRLPAGVVASLSCPS